MNGMRYTSGGTIYCQDTTSVWAIFSSRVYDKGAWVLHMLRHVVGDENFFNILDAYYHDARYAWGDITTLEFRDICEDVSGMDLHQFFEDWIFGEYYPQYRYSYVYDQYGPDDYLVFVHVRQAQTSTPQVFDMPLDLEVFDGASYHKTVVNNNQREQDYILNVTDAALPPQSVRLDRWDWILKSASTETYQFRIIYQAMHGGSQYAAYNDSVIAKGGEAPYDYSITSGSLPNGLSLNATTGKITGTPTQAGSFSFTVRVEDDLGSSDAENYQIFVALGSYVPGDADNSGAVDIDDAVWLIAYIFQAGPAPIPPNAGDADGSCAVDIDDVVYQIAYIFQAGPTPQQGCVE